MSLPVVLRPEASRDAEEARDYLEGLRLGLGHDFLDHLNEALTQIGALPHLYRVVWRNVRAAKWRRFTYLVDYRVHDDRADANSLSIRSGKTEIRVSDDKLWVGGKSFGPVKAKDKISVVGGEVTVNGEERKPVS